MGSYNPYAPIILGQEWPGIREEATQFSPAVDVVESGHTFTTTTSYPLQDTRFYIDDVGIPGNAAEEAYLTAIYPTGSEADSGPVQRLIIPCEAVLATGASTSSGTGAAPLQSPQLTNYYFLDPTLADSFISMSFNVQPYTILQGKRIVGVNFLVAAHRFFNTDVRSNGPYIYLNDQPVPSVGNKVRYSTGNEVPEGGSTTEDNEILSIPLGELSRLWNSAPDAAEQLPWNFADLSRFDASASSRMYMTIVTGTNWGTAGLGGILYVWYAALEVLYCEETRTMVGGNYRAVTGNKLNYGANPTRLRSIARAINPTLSAGNWTVTVSAADLGGAESVSSSYPDLNALRELYALPTHEGVQINLTDVVGEEFSRESVNVLTQISVHASGGAPLTEVHAYGRLAPAPVYGTTTATQEIYDNTAGVAASYPQVRFYARNWGRTSQPLVLTGVGALAGSTVSIDPTAFDALDEIVDGWKQIDLRFDTPPTMGASSPDPQWTWSSAAETAGNRWEILAVSAPAASGTVGSLLTTVPAAERLGPATYQPPVGSTVELAWASQSASGTAVADPDTDAVILFSQDPPTITGLAVSTLSQAVTGIGTGCGGATPCCIPTAISYNRVTWSMASMAVSGGYFGAYELQRFDAVGGVFETIMSASSQAVTGFNDYEARVGQLSAYRIRALNLYRFAGSWSAMASGTITAPGVTTQCDTDNSGAGTLIFTSNEVQSGAANLAYVKQFDRGIDEPFDFPEAGQVRRRRRYDRDFVTAFHGTERGGERFQCTLLVQAAAGALPNMGNMRSLRELAWDDLPYVCVRDELGNRWLANIIVPDGNINQRSSYFASVDIQEVQALPSEVDPS